MGHWDKKNFRISVKLRESCSDQRILDWQKEKDYNYTSKEVRAFRNTLSRIYHPVAEKIIRFLVEYKSGILLPDRWDYGEPLKHDFIPSDIDKYIEILSYPSGWLVLNKRRKYYCYIKNGDFGFWWEDDKPLRPKVEPECLVRLDIYFSKQSKPKMEFMQQLTDDMAEYLGTDYAKIIDQELTRPPLHLYEEDPQAVIYDAASKKKSI